MQIGPILNISSAAPASAAQSPAVQNALNAGPTQNPNDTNSNDLTSGSQFGSLLTPSVKSTKALNPVDDSAETVTPPGDAAKNAPQANNSIAIPLYIDQPIATNLPKAPDTALADVSGNLNNKQPIFSPQLAPASGKAAVVASEVADKQLDEEVSGKIPLQQFAQAEQAQQDPEFAKAVANLTNPNKIKALKVADAEQNVVRKLPPVSDKTSIAAKSTDDNEQVLAKNSADTTAAAKITAKVLAVKNETVASDDSDETATPSATANLQDFAAQLKTRSFSEVKAAHEALAQTPAEQVQIKISQAIGSGTNNIKIHLHPVELGMVDVDMDTDHAGNTKISITADKAETLNLLKNDSHNLTKSLADAGIKTDNATMQFNLRGDNQNQQQRDFSNNNFQQNNSSNSAQQQANNTVGARSAYTTLNEHTLTLSANRGLNILV